MDHEAKEPAAVGRSQNALHLLPHDAAAAEAFLAPLLARLDDADGVQLLVMTSDAEAAAALAGTAVRLLGDAPQRVVPVAGPRRAERRLRGGASVVIGAAADLLELVRRAVLKLDDVRGVAVAWADELGPADLAALESLFTELPKGGARTIVATTATAGVEALVERYARRARRAVGAGDEGAAVDVEAATAVSAGSGSGAGAAHPTDLGFVTAAPAGRAAALRRVIDALDPATVRVIVRTDESERAARQALAAMGHGAADESVVVVRGDRATDMPAAELAVLFDLPPSAAAVSSAAAGSVRTVALVQPRQIASLRVLAGGGSVNPVALPESRTRGQAEVAALRAALVGELEGGGIGRELLVLEPLLDEHDPMELAAAALRLATRSASAMPAAGQGATSGPTVTSRPAARPSATDRERPSRPRGDSTPRSRNFDRQRPPRERPFDRDRPPRERPFDRDRPPRERSFDRDRPTRGASDRPPRSGPPRDRSDRDSRSRDAGARGPDRPPRPTRPTRPRRDEA